MTFLYKYTMQWCFKLQTSEVEYQHCKYTTLLRLCRGEYTENIMAASIQPPDIFVLINTKIAYL